MGNGKLPGSIFLKITSSPKIEKRVNKSFHSRESIASYNQIFAMIAPRSATWLNHNRRNCEYSILAHHIFEGRGWKKIIGIQWPWDDIGKHWRWLLIIYNVLLMCPLLCSRLDEDSRFWATATTPHSHPPFHSKPECCKMITKGQLYRKLDIRCLPSAHLDIWLLFVLLAMFTIPFNHSIICKPKQFASSFRLSFFFCCSFDRKKK